MKRLLIKIAAILFIVAGLIAVLWPVPTWRLYDGNWQALAMTHAENFCAGQGIVNDSGAINNNINDPAVDACIAASELGDTPSVAHSQRWFCEGIQSKLSGFTNCLNQVQQYQIWGLAHGGFTREWNDSNSYPQIIDYDITQAPRRAGRQDDTRNDNGRGFGE